MYVITEVNVADDVLVTVLELVLVAEGVAFDLTVVLEDAVTVTVTTGVLDIVFVSTGVLVILILAEDVTDDVDVLLLKGVTDTVGVFRREFVRGGLLVLVLLKIDVAVFVFDELDVFVPIIDLDVLGEAVPVLEALIVDVEVGVFLTEKDGFVVAEAETEEDEVLEPLVDSVSVGEFVIVFEWGADLEFVGEAVIVLDTVIDDVVVLEVIDVFVAGELPVEVLDITELALG